MLVKIKDWAKGDDMMINLHKDILMDNKIYDAVHARPVETNSPVSFEPQEKTQSPVLKNLNANPENLFLSPVSKQLDALKASLQDVPEMNAARVLYFKNEIESGHYQINHQTIASKMLNHVEMASS